jgi:acetyl-CoA carboxylase biotin carboxyl carrier protein
VVKPEETASQAMEPIAKAAYLEVKSPMVGTFYRSPSPDKPPYVKVGDVIKPGQVVCMVEAMKLFNEIESELAGTIVKILVEDAAPVEYDQVLFLVEPA